eukprot:2743904-Amphidinium_carterae.1
MFLSMVWRVVDVLDMSLSRNAALEDHKVLDAKSKTSGGLYMKTAVMGCCVHDSCRKRTRPLTKAKPVHEHGHFPLQLRNAYALCPGSACYRSRVRLMRGQTELDVRFEHCGLLVELEQFMLALFILDASIIVLWFGGSCRVYTWPLLRIRRCRKWAISSQLAKPAICSWGRSCVRGARGMIAHMTPISDRQPLMFTSNVTACRGALAHMSNIGWVIVRAISITYVFQFLVHCIYGCT